MGESAETERTAVKTYVPRYQKKQWVEHADELDMSQSEFVRTMVQAGRRGFADGADDRSERNPEEVDSPGANPGGDGLESVVLDILSDRGALDWGELLNAVTEDVEKRLDEALSSLQERNQIRHSGRHGGYVLNDGE